MGLISENDERAYLEEIKHRENWCQGNNLLLNVSKTKQLIVDCSKKQERHYQPVRINGTTVERVDRFWDCQDTEHASSANANSASANNANGAVGAGNGACAEPTIEQCPLIITESDATREFKRVNSRKAAGSDGICGRVLKDCADQLAPVFTDIFNFSLTLGIVPSSFKRSTIGPVPKKPPPSGLDDYRPVALTSVVMKCFDKLVRDFITSSLPASMDPLQFAYRHNRSTDDAIAHLL
ncbi:hypothetical protein P4O66_004512 [Electrophorus voltai]|uniref:Reverse transcriptase domain-containing protein n=1 Tax=Electrophorus voltai TaxID=2609070 RepID=A0AAD8ZNS6_9TELE|nr:hypothetical protein P4O66_004512 [Electrophorus voltai]